jgi:endoglucanase
MQRYALVRPIVRIFCLACCTACGTGNSPKSPFASNRLDSGTPLDAHDRDVGYAQDGGNQLKTGLRVQGNRIIDDGGQNLFLHGVGRQGTEYMCSKYGGIFDGPNDQASIAAMRAWNVNSVRVFLNEDCWLGINGVDSTYSGATYIAAIKDYVALLERNAITPILDLQLAAPGTTLANYPQLPMADRDHSPAFWASVAQTFGQDTAVIFDLYNEPYPDSDQDTTAAWICWRDGGDCPGLDYKAAGMQELVDAVRGAGAQNLLLAAGIRYGNVLTHWRDYRPNDPLGNLAIAWHIYNVNLCHDAACWNSDVAPLLQDFPLIATEMGEFDCAYGFINQAMDFLESNGASYSANAWNAGPGWPCGSDDAKSGPALITDFSGTPTSYGLGYRDHLLSLR